MIEAIRIRRAVATASLALAFVSAPLALTATAGLAGLTAAAREAESGGKREAGDDKGGRSGNKAGDDHPGAHSQNGKNRK